MILYLCRHGEAVPEGDVAPTDELRWLSMNGRSQVTVVGRSLAESGDVPDIVLTSPLVRAVQTADILARETGCLRVEARTALVPDGSLGELIEELAPLAQRRVFVVGHEPLMSGWTGQLLGRRAPVAFRPGTVVRLDFEGEAEPGAASASFVLGPDGVRTRI